ncbi:MAG: L-ascorbate metabolism protein UlaG (beta-lactamase superfamily) [Congregibacter sp.]
MEKILAILIFACGLLSGLTMLLGCSINTPISEEGAERIAQSPHQHEGRFFNLEPKADYKFDMNVLIDTLFKASQRSPKGEIPFVKISPDHWEKRASQTLHVAWLGHSSNLIEMDHKRILIDPVLSKRASPFSFAGPKRLHPSPIDLASISNVDGVIISHSHYDHLDEATIRHLAKGDCRFFIPLGLKDQLLAWDVKDESIVELDWWQKAQLGEIDIVMTPARHYSNRGLSDAARTLWASWSIMGSQKIFFSGDTGYSKEFAKIGERLGPFDLSLIKVGAYGPGQSWHDIHMTPEEAVQVHQDIKGKVMLPVHWATFDLALHTWGEPIKRTVKASDAAGINLVTPKIGALINPDQSEKSDQWWQHLN